jgi:hypothetical protein
VARDEIPEAQGLESHPTEGSVLALQAVDPVGDADLGGAEVTIWSVPEPAPMAPGAEKFVVDLGGGSSTGLPRRGRMGKG